MKLKVGDIRFEVEWCTKFYIDERGEHDFDRDEWSFKDFLTIDLARKFAETVTSVGWGVAQIRRKVVVQESYMPVGYLDWEYDDRVFEEVNCNAGSLKGE